MGTKAKNYNHNILQSEKDRDWYIYHADAILKQSKFSGEDYNSDDKKCDDIINGVIRKKDYVFMTNPYGAAGKQIPISVANFPIVKGSYNLLKGEELKRQVPFRVLQIGDNAIQEKKEIEKKMIVDNLQTALLIQAQNAGLVEQVQDENTGQRVVPKLMHPEEIEKYMTYTWRGKKEVVMQRLLRLEESDANLFYWENEAFGDSLKYNKEIWCVDFSDTYLKPRKVNPLMFDCLLSSQSPFIEDGEAWVEKEYMYPSEVFTRFYNELNLKENKESRIKLENYSSNLFANSGRTATNGHPSRIVFVDAVKMDEDEIANDRPDGVIDVYNIVFTSRRKLIFLKYIDEFDGLEKETVCDDTFKQTKKPLYDEDGNLVEGQEIEEVWINQYCRAVKIDLGTSDGFYIKTEPVPTVGQDIDNLSQMIPPYIGGWWSEPSFVKEAIPYQKLYNILMAKLQFVFQKSKDKLFLMDITQIPRQYGWDVEKWLYYADVLGVALINPFEEGKGQGKGKTSKFNQFTALDLSMGNIIQQTVIMLDKIELMLGQATGITPQRKGQTTSSETLGGVERSVTQSSHITEPYFMKHYEVKRRLRNAILNVAKVVRNGKKLRMSQDDLGVAELEITDAISNESYGIFATNESAEWNNLMQMKNALSQYASATQDIDVILEAIPSRSSAEITAIAKQHAQAKREQAAQMQKEQNDTQLSINKSKTDLVKEEIDSKERASKYHDDTLIEIERMRLDKEFALSVTGGDDEGAEALDKEIKELELKLMGEKIHGDLEERRKQRVETAKLKREEIASKERIARTNRKVKN